MHVSPLSISRPSHSCTMPTTLGDRPPTGGAANVLRVISEQPSDQFAPPRPSQPSAGCDIYNRAFLPLRLTHRRRGCLSFSLAQHAIAIPASSVPDLVAHDITCPLSLLHAYTGEFGYQFQLRNTGNIKPSSGPSVQTMRLANSRNKQSARPHSNATTNSNNKRPGTSNTTRPWPANMLGIEAVRCFCKQAHTLSPTAPSRMTTEYDPERRDAMPDPLYNAQTAD